MNSKPMISVIVPVYKVEPYLDRCVQSITDQTYENLEIILVDDGSPDNCGAMCDAWAEKDSRIKVIHKKNGGGAQARNVGLDSASGRMVGFVDSDDYLFPAMYEKLLCAIQEQKCDIAECGYFEVGSDRYPAEERTVENVRIFNTVESLRENVNDRICRQVVWNKLYMREAIGAIRFVEEKIIDDEFFTYRVLEKARSVVVLDEKLYCYRQQPNSTMHQGYSLSRLDGLEARYLRMNALQKYDELVWMSRQALVMDCMWHYQSASRVLEGSEKEKALAYIRDMMKKIPPIPVSRLTGKLTHRVWAVMFQQMPDFTVSVRNRMGIGL